MTTPKRYTPPRVIILTPLGHWYVARLRLLAHLAGKCKVQA